MTCDTCRKRKTCTELCDEAEAYVSQDNEPQFTRGREITYSLNLITQMSDTGITLKEIEERKTQEILFYFQKIHTMKDSVEKVIMSCIFTGMPIERIAKYTKMSWQNVYALLKKLEQ